MHRPNVRACVCLSLRIHSHNHVYVYITYTEVLSNVSHVNSHGLIFATIGWLPTHQVPTQDPGPTFSNLETAPVLFSFGPSLPHKYFLLLYLSTP